MHGKYDSYIYFTAQMVQIRLTRIFKYLPDAIKY